MKKRLIYPLLLSLSIIGVSGCAKPCSHDYYLEINKDNLKFEPQIKGTKFDKTGLEVTKKCHNCNYVEEILDYDIEGADSILSDSYSLRVRTADGLEANLEGETREKIKVACVGDSLTYGHIWQSEAYPIYLQEYLGERFNVGNFGENGVSITGYGGSYDNHNERYINRAVYTQSKAFNPDVIVMCLGTNDGTNWESAKETFIEDYHTLIDAYLRDFPLAQWVFMVSPPCEEPNPYSINNEAMRENVNPVQRDLAEEYDFPLIDLRDLFEEMDDNGSSMLRQENYMGRPDKVHLSKAGAQYVAELVKETMDPFIYRQ